MKFLGCCLSMNIPFPSLEVPCLVLSFQFHNLCHKECVSRFDLARLSLRLGPTPCPVHRPMSLDVIPGPSHSCILHLASSRIWTALLHTFCIFHLYFCTICVNGSRCILASMHSFKACYNKSKSECILLRTTLQLRTASLSASVMGIARAAIGNCIKANVAPTKAPTALNTAQCKHKHI